jgi:hypothetical protein
MIKTASLRGLFYCLIVCGVPNVLSFQTVSRSHLFGTSWPRDQRCMVEHKGKTKLQSAILTAVDSFCRTSPYAAAGLLCGVKASAADFIAQRRQYQKRGSEDAEIQMKEDGSLALEKPKADLQRNLAYIVYGSIYQGITQEYVYNHLYPVFFGAGTDIRTVLIKVGFDLIVQTTLFTLPIAYMSKALIYRYSFREAFRRYFDDIRKHGLLTKYYALWGPVQCMTFSIVPEHLRIPFIAIVSFFWLIILSSIASKTPVIDDDECSLIDGQTCNIDG